MRGGTEARRARQTSALGRLLDAPGKTERDVREIHALQGRLGEPRSEIVVTTEQKVATSKVAEPMVSENGDVKSVKKQKIRKQKRTTERKQVR